MKLTPKVGKTLIAGILCLAPATALVTGCGGGNGNSPTKVLPGGTTQPTNVPTTAPTNTPATFAGNYSSGLRAGETGETSFVSFRINSDGTVTNTTPGNTNALTGSVNGSGLLNFNYTDTAAGVLAVSTQLTRSGASFGGNGTFTNPRGNGTIQVRQAIASSPYAGTYTGTLTIQGGQPANQQVATTIRVENSGQVVFDPSNSDSEFDNLINTDGSFEIVNVDDNDVTTRITGNIANNQATGTYQTTSGQTGNFVFNRSIS